ncbi:MAG: leucyl aminopeptidase [Candidatus Gastranaerophilales bacterium]|nr:leucyl aminopeptidase [Candidatus Gastranaerophilales bacterium]
MEIYAKLPQETEADVIVTGFFEDDKTLNDTQKSLDEKYEGAISKNILEIENFKGKYLETFALPVCGAKILAVGLGKKEEFNVNKVREAAAKTIKQAEKLSKKKTVAFNFQNNGNMCCCKIAYNAALGSIMGEYDFDKYKSKKNEEKIERVEIIHCKPEKMTPAIEKAVITGDAMDFTKDLISEPAEFATPAKISEIATKLANENGFEIKVFGKDELKTMNFNAFLAVGQGSIQEPKFIHIKYTPENPEKKIAIIGKGITFDSGGLDIKPPASMLTMKTDMSGCACVLGVMKAIAKLKPNVEVHMLSALCENMPSGSSYKVGDVLIAKNGKTIEVDNTDAEGRLTLADALTYADELNVDEVIDVATLTGAVIVALGNTITGIMGNDEEFVKEIIEDSKEAGENLWQMPILDDMQDNLKSDIADMRNTGSRYAGASTAARFLSNFTKAKKWAHLDIAGTAFLDKPYKELNKGATAAMVRTLIQHIAK